MRVAGCVVVCIYTAVDRNVGRRGLGGGGVWRVTAVVAAGATDGGARRADLGLYNQNSVTELRVVKSRFFAHHPRTGLRSGPRSLRMTPSIFVACFRDSHTKEDYSMAKTA